MPGDIAFDPTIQARVAIVTWQSLLVIELRDKRSSRIPEWYLVIMSVYKFKRGGVCLIFATQLKWNERFARQLKDGV
jgi:hypothetical protein